MQKNMIVYLYNERLVLPILSAILISILFGKNISFFAKKNKIITSQGIIKKIAILIVNVNYTIISVR
ncbi:hypothetical protein BJP37_11775 [Moorena bouillonii PNG]|uniref:Uncharacterized protein n=1 Tax=Moorena bouillonii PNG TaxID=568701 RepID=A0A1U7N0W6_9CYAN|nr:hypothetical protein BJP37_11775 [Moorena bouillonii PNG]